MKIHRKTFITKPAAEYPAAAKRRYNYWNYSPTITKHRNECYICIYETHHDTRISALPLHRGGRTVRQLHSRQVDRDTHGHAQGTFQVLCGFAPGGQDRAPGCRRDAFRARPVHGLHPRGGERRPPDAHPQDLWRRGRGDLQAGDLGQCHHQRAVRGQPGIQERARVRGRDNGDRRADRGRAHIPAVQREDARRSRDDGQLQGQESPQRRGH